MATLEKGHSRALWGGPDEVQVLDFRGTDAALNEKLLSPVWQGYRGFWPLLFVTGLGVVMLFTAITYTLITGIGVWGNNNTDVWGYAIINFVWWIGIGHAGTFISAVLHLFHQPWRQSINRIAETMTLFAVVNAAIFPALHLGRAWFAYWLVPYPSTMGVWPNFRSALPWDFGAISTYGTVSLLFWYVGLVPDFAAVRDLAPSIGQRRFYGVLALGWRGSAQHWRHYRIAYLLLAGVATPLVISVHSIVSTDFAIGLLPGWHSTVFPPYFVAGAIFSGFAMVLTILIPMRWWFRLYDVVTVKHLDAMAKITLVTSWVVTYAYIIETFLAWYSGDTYEMYTLLVMRPFGPYAVGFWTMILCNSVVPQLLWFRALRRNSFVLFIVSILVNVGMWFERFILIITSQARDFLPSSWQFYWPTWIDASIFVGTIFFFLFLILLALRFIPIIPLTEVKELKHELAHGAAHEDRTPHTQPGRTA